MANVKGNANNERGSDLGIGLILYGFIFLCIVVGWGARKLGEWSGT